MPVREPRLVEPRNRDGGADLGSLVAMGVEEPPPVPATQPFLEPDWPPADEGE